MNSKILLVFSVFFLSVPATAFAQDKPEITIGGALRFNYNLSSWKDGQKARGGDFGYDMFRINAKGKYKGVKLNAEYRLYSSAFGGGMLKQGWVGYDFNAEDNLQIGLTQVPFGITQYNSHNWFFGINYYLGLEDDHDMGIKYSHTSEKWMYALAFFKNAEELNFGSLSDLSTSRYSYDISSFDVDGDGQLDLRNKEVNQLNGKVLYFINGEHSKHQIGASAMYGGVQNLDTEAMGSHYALSLHYELNVALWNFKTQLTTYNIQTKNPEDEPSNITAMAAYGAPYLVASEANTYTLGVSRDIPVNWGPISNLQLYNDFGYVDKVAHGFEATTMNVTGALVTAGNVYTYIDFASGKNMPWLNPDYSNSLAQGSQLTDNWELRFNINIGYYF